MKKYIPIDFDEKGKPILGNAKDNPTSNGFIPTTWAPGGGSDEGKNGIKSVTISPAISTTPALESSFPIYWEDLTEEQKANGVDINLVTTDAMGGEYVVTITPTSEWYAFASGGIQSTNKGDAITTRRVPTGDNNILTVNAGVAASPDEDSEDERYFQVRVTITKSNK